ncbi:hypothetical protein B0H10DRAFT_1937776 [Mycena sp. CBHHK59/15]|nr:hypothetical protein B0H10DRAFT_1937776 [Mycena sp. CBHHK59/15]
MAVFWWINVGDCIESIGPLLAQIHKVVHEAVICLSHHTKQMVQITSQQRIMTIGDDKAGRWGKLKTSLFSDRNINIGLIQIESQHPSILLLAKGAHMQLSLGGSTNSISQCDIRASKGAVPSPFSSIHHDIQIAFQHTTNPEKGQCLTQNPHEAPSCWTLAGLALLCFSQVTGFAVIIRTKEAQDREKIIQLLLHVSEWLESQVRFVVYPVTSGGVKGENWFSGIIRIHLFGNKYTQLGVSHHHKHHYQTAYCSDMHRRILNGRFHAESNQEINQGSEQEASREKWESQGLLVHKKGPVCRNLGSPARLPHSGK